jgi:hypothetical protein
MMISLKKLAHAASFLGSSPSQMTKAAVDPPANLISVERWSVDHNHWLRGIVGRYEQPLTTFAARILGDPELARDVVQDTFVRLGESGPWQLKAATRPNGCSKSAGIARLMSAAA